MRRLAGLLSCVSVLLATFLTDPADADWVFPKDAFHGQLVSALEPSKQGYFPIRWRKQPSEADVARAFPKDARFRGQALVKCAIRRDGQLTSCHFIAIDPRNDTRYAQTVQALLPLFRLSAKEVSVARAQNLTVLFTIPISRPDAEAPPSGPCDPPWCVPVPPPPPQP